MKIPQTILFLNENPLPPVFTTNTISGKELRLRAALPEVTSIHVVSRRGTPVIKPGSAKQTGLEKKIHVHLLPPCPYYLSPVPLFLWGLYFALKYRPQTIEAESPILSGPAAIIISKLRQIPAIIEVRASYDHLINFRLSFIPKPIKTFVLNTVLSFVYTHAHAIIANSRTYQTQIKQRGYPSTVINPGLQNPPSKFKTLKPLSSPIQIGYLGRLVDEKGVHVLLKAISMLRNQTKIPDFKLQIAGDGPSFTSLKQQATQLGIDHLVTFLGWQDNYQFLSTIDILVNPNLVAHPLEMVNAEAAYMSVPVISFGDKHIPETVIHNQTGIIVTQKTPQTLATAIQKLLTSPKQLTKLSRQSHTFATKNYDFQQQATSLKRLYKQI